MKNLKDIKGHLKNEFDLFINDEIKYKEVYKIGLAQKLNKNVTIEKFIKYQYYPFNTLDEIKEIFNIPSNDAMNKFERLEWLKNNF